MKTDAGLPPSHCSLQNWLLFSCELWQKAVNCRVWRTFIPWLDILQMNGAHPAERTSDDQTPFSTNSHPGLLFCNPISTGLHLNLTVQGCQTLFHPRQHHHRGYPLKYFLSYAVSFWSTMMFLYNIIKDTWSCGTKYSWSLFGCN